jgi:ABC-type iron transport system FetAB ATPase subunit
MAIVTQLYFQIVEEINYFFSALFWVGHHQVQTRILEKTNTLQCGHQEWGNENSFYIVLGGM